MNTAKKIGNIMSGQLINVNANLPLEEAYSILRDNWIRHLPVVDENNHVIGIISDRDFSRAIVPDSKKTLPSYTIPEFPPLATVGMYMSSDPFTISIDGDLKEAVQIMVETKTSACLVAKNGEMVGIITSEDLLKLLTEYLEKPSGSMRERIEAYLMNSPLGAIGQMLSNAGI
jgi:CBS domain-containing protein